MNGNKCAVSSVAAWRRKVEKKLLLSWPLLWFLRLPQVIIGSALATLAIGSLLWLSPVDLKVPWIPSSEQVFYVVLLVSSLVLVGWATGTLRRWRSPVQGPRFIGGALTLYVLSSIAITSIMSVPIILGYAQRWHIMRASADWHVVPRQHTLVVLADACAEALRRACDDDLPWASSTVWREHPVCLTKEVWYRLANRGWDDISGFFDFHFDIQTGQPVPADRLLAAERVVPRLEGYIRDAGLDLGGENAVKLGEFQRSASALPSYRVCGESMRIVEPLQADLLRIHGHVSHVATESSDRYLMAPNWTSIYVLVLVATYSALLLVLVATAPRGSLRIASLLVFGGWGLLSFCSMFFFSWEQRQFVHFLLAVWGGGIVGAGFASVRRRAWRAASVAAIGSLLLTPVVAMLVIWSQHEWKSYEEGGGALDVIIMILTEPTSWMGRRQEVIGAGAWCLVVSWILSGALLIPYHWVAERAASLPLRDGQD